MVSPSNTGAGIRTSSQPMLANTFIDRSMVDCPVTRARVKVELTNGRPNSVPAAKLLSTCALATFCVTRVNHWLSASVTVLPKGW